MKFDEWIKSVPLEITGDTVWNLQVYQASLYLSDICWEDTRIILDQKFFSLADQLYRSTASVSANISEGYSRNSNKEKARFYEISLGSARESKDWYFKSRFILGDNRSLNRMRLLTSIIKLLFTMINEKRNSYHVTDLSEKYIIKELDKVLKS